MVPDPMDQADIDTTGTYFISMFYIELIPYSNIVSTTHSTSRSLEQQQQQQQNLNRYPWYTF